MFAIGTPARSAIEAYDLSSGRARVLRFARRDAALSNPARCWAGSCCSCARRAALSSCAWALAVEPGRPRVRERTLLSLPSTVHRDTGYERRFTHAYNSASKCPNRAAGLGGSVQLGTTALAGNGAFVTEYAPATGAARIVAVRR